MPHSRIIFLVFSITYLCHFPLVFQSLVESSSLCVLFTSFWSLPQNLFSFLSLWDFTNIWSSLLIYSVFWLIFNYVSAKHKHFISNTYNVILRQTVSYFPSLNWKRQKISPYLIFTVLVYVSYEAGGSPGKSASQFELHTLMTVSYPMKCGIKHGKTPYIHYLLCENNWWRCTQDKEDCRSSEQI